MLNRELLEQQLCELPLFQYAFLKTADLVFTERVRTICEVECPMYNTNWACPPAVGTVEECKARCMRYQDALMISTVTEVSDIVDIDRTLRTRAPHEAITREVTALVRRQCADTLTLSTESCVHCAHCTWPNAPCRFPEKMYPCVESYGILATDIAEKCGMDFFNGNIVTWFSLILYKD